jgi:hypothetical protein
MMVQVTVPGPWITVSNGAGLHPARAEMQNPCPGLLGWWKCAEIGVMTKPPPLEALCLVTSS